MEEERELKYLLREIPPRLTQSKSKKLVDIYIPRKEGHAAIRIRQQGDVFQITKKTPSIVEGICVLNEETISITEEEFAVFKTMRDARVLEKTRYYYPFEGHVLEIDVFGGALSGLVLAEVEFDSLEALRAFDRPYFFGEDVTHRDFLAGGVLYKLTYADIKDTLFQLGYTTLHL